MIELIIGGLLLFSLGALLFTKDDDGPFVIQDIYSDEVRYFQRRDSQGGPVFTPDPRDAFEFTRYVDAEDELDDIPGGKIRVKAEVVR